MKPRIVCTFAVALATLLWSCIPGDTRPPPAQVLVTVQVDDSGSLGPLRWETEDRWTIALDRMFAVVGGASLGGDDCNGYAGGSYARVFDLRVREAQKLTLIFGLGRCEIEYSVRPPPGDTLLASGVSPADVAAMRTPASDAYVSRKGTSLRVQGAATRDGRTKRFDWSFRETLRFEGCVLAGEPFVADETRTIALRVHGDALFASAPEAGAPLRFDVYAEADDRGDADGEITLAELDRLPLAGAAYPTLGEQLYRALYPLVVRADGATGCSIEVGDWD